MPNSRPGIPQDSLAIARAFVHNAKPLLDSLTALHFARIQIGRLKTDLTQRETQRDGLASSYTQAQQQIVGFQLESLQVRGELSRIKRKRRFNLVEIWLWRVGAGYLVYKKICPSCRP
ncbi:hypothetical protein GCM10028819_31990 [Spirosoma humi]